jgi:hypothetical protein
MIIKHRRVARCSKSEDSSRKNASVTARLLGLYNTAHMTDNDPARRLQQSSSNVDGNKPISIFLPAKSWL